MWISILAVFTVLSTFTHSIPAPFDVSVTCDSYGVMVQWMAQGLSKQAEFLFELRGNHGELYYKRTKNSRYNISDLLENTAYNHFFVKVKAKDGDKESTFAESQKFSFSPHQLVNITCDLEFPPVRLIPQDGKLFVNFTNPLHLYRKTPALRNLQENELLSYTVNNKMSSCFLKSLTCETNVSFPKEQKKYCVTLGGWIRQTRVVTKERYCYEGTLHPGPPVTVYLIPVAVAFAAFLILVLATVFLSKKVIKRINEEILSNFPPFLEDKKKPRTSLFIPVDPELDPMIVNIIPTVITPLDSIPCSQESSAAYSDELSDCSKNMLESSASSELCHDQSNEYGTGADLSSSGFSSGYDQPHVFISTSS
ncbi:interferon gamma receptor 1 [Neoarius graeffei]|uniref:interferon gamma receptor 1 n=1 Tax=Neoarius graeffei TaxID=443677 RepID=UPI00298C35FD|nr:interferon gamma receptor 1 [Neoarius graeffei]